MNAASTPAPEPVPISVPTPVSKPALRPAPKPPRAAPESDLSQLLGEGSPAPWYRRRMVWAAAAAVLLLAAGLTAWFWNRAAQALPTYTTATVARGDLTLTVTANGTVQPTRSINIGSELSGTVLKVQVDVNDMTRPELG